MKFEAGDCFISTEEIENWRLLDTLYKITKITAHAYHYVGSDGKPHSFIDSNHAIKAVIDNKLNRKLYPNYIEKNGYLIRKNDEA